MKENNYLTASPYAELFRAHCSTLSQMMTPPKISLESLNRVPSSGLPISLSWASLGDSQPEEAILLGSPEVGVDRKS